MVIGAGYGGATAAKYLRMWSGGSIEVLVLNVTRQAMAAMGWCPSGRLFEAAACGAPLAPAAGLGAGGRDVVPADVEAADEVGQRAAAVRGDELQARVAVEEAVVDAQQQADDDGGQGDPPVIWERSPVPAEFQVRGLGPIMLSVPDLNYTDIVLQNPGGNTGSLRIQRGDTPLLVVETSNVDVSWGDEVVDDLLKQIRNSSGGTRYYVPR